VVPRENVRRAVDSLRDRVLWMALGLVLGALSSTALTSVLLASRLATVEAEIRALRRDVDRMPAKP